MILSKLPCHWCLSTNLRALSYLPRCIKEEKPQRISSFLLVTTYLKDSVPALVLLYAGKMGCMKWNGRSKLSVSLLLIYPPLQSANPTQFLFLHWPLYLCKFKTLNSCSHSSRRNVFHQIVMQISLNSCR